MKPADSGSWIEVDLSAVGRNLAAVREKVGARCGILAVVKSNAYGHGAVELARAAEKAGAAGLCVANLAEARQLREGGVTAPIILLNSGPVEQAEEIVRLGLIQTIYDGEMARALSAEANTQGTTGKIHLKVDTGMTRLGVCAAEAPALAAEIAELPNLEVEAAFTHLATAEEADTSYAQEQFACFQESLGQLKEIFPKIKAHLANSAAALRFAEMRLDYVRVGLLVYGVYPTTDDKKYIDLTPALSWKTRVLFVKQVEKGTKVSYGCRWTAPRKTTLVILPVGYAEGYPRSLSNRSQVLMQNGLRPVVATVCMNHIFVDAGPEATVRPGEEVILLGQSEAGRVTATELAKWGETVPHEILARLAEHIPREYSE